MTVILEAAKQYKQKRVLAILQLCVIFTYIAWSCLQPPLDEYVSHHSKGTLYRTLIGNSTYFKELPEEKQLSLISDYQALQHPPSSNFLEKALNATLNTGQMLLFGIPPFMQAWLCFSFAICLMLLLDIEGASAAAWVLPLLVVAHALVSQLYGVPAEPTAEEKLFPTEAYIVENYLKSPPSGSAAEHRALLMNGWHNYLAAEWAKESPSKESPSKDLKIQSEQASRGEYAFNLARLETLTTSKQAAQTRPFHIPLTPLLFFAPGFLWSLYFAWKLRK